VLVGGSLEAHLVNALAWLSFGGVHSLLAGDWSKRHLRPILDASYRLSYNAFATVHLMLIWWLGHMMFKDETPFGFPVEFQRLLLAVYVCGWLIMLVGMRGYDLGRLAGIRQILDSLRGVQDTDDEPLRLDGLHRYVRHPLYTAGFLILWGRVTGEFDLATALWGSLYLLIGTWFEERRLVRLYGAEYAEYRRRVPAFFPWKGRAY